MCGAHEMAWINVTDTAYCICYKSNPKFFPEFMTARQQDILQSLCRQIDYKYFHHLVNYTKFSLCSDARGRIYALLSLWPEEESGLVIEPNYTKSTSEVYQGFVRHYIKDQKWLKILTSIEINDNPILSQPSWVPNWTEPRTTYELDESLHAGANSEAEVAFPIDGVLRVTGCMVGGIDAIEPFELSEPNARPDTDVEVAMEVRRVIQRLSIPDLLDQRGLKMRSLCRVLLSDRFSELYVPPDQNQVSIESTEQTLRDILTRPTADFVKDMPLSTSSRRILKHICSIASAVVSLSSWMGHSAWPPKLRDE
jgi:hypothetical protein